MMQKRPELHQQFDAVYDKDSFGALALDLRAAYCQRLSEYCQPGAVLYVEVKNKPNSSSSSGPPHHVEKQDLMQASSFDTHFEHVIALGQVNSLAGRIPPGSGWTQMGHMLRRK